MTESGQDPSPVKVMVVCDSDISRELLTEVLESAPGITIAAKPLNGFLAASRLKSSEIDVVVLDIGMSELDGVANLPKIFAVDVNAKILLVSTLSFRNVKVGMEALLAGAADFVSLPSPSRRLRKISIDHALRDELVVKVEALGLAHRRLRRGRPATAVAKRSYVLNKAKAVRPNVLAIGGSTGGPKVLLQLLGRLPATIRRPILIVQHMPPTFTATLAASISKQSSWPCREAVDGEEIQNGRAYIAPGGVHMVIEAEGTRKLIRLNDDPPVHFCRPAVDPLFSCIAKVYGRHSLAVVLTGMGEDGVKGCQAIVEAGGAVIAQDEDTSVVWGMPGAVAAAGLCRAILPAKEIAPFMREYATRS